MDYYLLTRNTIAMDDKKLQLMKEERIRRFKKLIGLNEDYSGVPEGAAICDPVAKPMDEDGAPAPSMNPNVYPELDEYIDRLTLGVQNLITKELNKAGDDPEMPYKAEYIVSGLIKGLQAPIV